MQYIQAKLEELQALVYSDAVEHKLFDCDAGIKGQTARREVQIAHIMDELKEALAAVDDTEHFAEQIADVVIMAFSQTAREGIPLSYYIVKKVMANRVRPVGHEDGKWRRPYRRGEKDEQ